MTPKSKKTTAIGIGSFILFLIALTVLIMDKITLEEFTAVIASITSFAIFLLGLSAKDRDVTHSDFYKKEEK